MAEHVAEDFYASVVFLIRADDGVEAGKKITALLSSACGPSVAGVDIAVLIKSPVYSAPPVTEIVSIREEKP